MKEIKHRRVIRHCIDVTYEMGDDDCLAAVSGPHTGRNDWEIGDLVWNPKMGEGHVLTETRECNGKDWYCGYCGGMMSSETGYCGTWVRCECGRFDPGDHHGYLLAKKRGIPVEIIEPRDLR